MGAGIATQLITVGATLSAVVLTLVSNAYLESRRARDTRELESLRLAAERAKWLRDERMKAYAGLSLAGEEVQQFVRSELPMLIGPNGAALRDATKTRWRELRTGLRKAYNQVALFGADDARIAGRHVWRTARNGTEDFLHDLDAGPDMFAPASDLSELIRALASDLGRAGERFLEVCRKDLQGD